MTEKMIAFLEEVSKDKAFLEKLQNAGTPEALIALAAEKGFQLTAEDLKQPEAASGELSDDELENVAGGANNQFKFGNDLLKMAMNMKKQYNGLH